MLGGLAPLSVYKGAAHVSSVSNKAVCVCVCAGGKISRLAGTHPGDIPCVIACVEWLGTAQACEADFTDIFLCVCRG